MKTGRIPGPGLSLATRFWAKVDKRGPDECWEWTGARQPQGYGTIGVYLGYRSYGYARSNRVAWELMRGPVPDGLHVLHSCDNPPCVNPNHLFLGTALDNIHDCIDKGRFNPRGLLRPKVTR
jgi:hypothetical protein